MILAMLKLGVVLPEDQSVSLSVCLVKGLRQTNLPYLETKLLDCFILKWQSVYLNLPLDLQNTTRPTHSVQAKEVLVLN
jgi:hypothetical protein